MGTSSSWDALRAAVATALVTHTEVLVASWERLARRELAPLAALPSRTLCEPVTPVVASAADALCDTGDAVPAAVVAHALARTCDGIGVEVLAGEYACMRAVLRDEVCAMVPNDAVRPAIAALDAIVDRWARAAVATWARKLDEAREQMIAILAHDLRSPLACITLAVDMLAESPSADSQADHLHDQIASAAERMQRLVSDVLDLERVRFALELPVAPRPDDLGAICRQVVDEVATAHPTRKIRVVRRGDLRGDFDRDRVAQAVSNLVGNAIEHGLGDVRVRLFEEADRRAVVVEVANRCAPSASGSLPAVASGTDRRLGFGLYIVHWIARAHGGTCTHSSSGGVTTATIRLPRRGEPAAVVHQLASQPAL